MSSRPRGSSPFLTGAAAPAVHCEVDGVEVDADLQSLTVAGVFIRTNRAETMDRELHIFLRTGAGSLATRAFVVQVITPAQAGAEGRDPGFGVLFSGLTETQRAMLKAARPAPSSGDPRASTVQRVRQPATRKVGYRPDIRSMPLTGQRAPAAREGMPVPNEAFPDEKPTTETLQLEMPPAPAVHRTSNEAAALRSKMRRELGRLESHAAWRVLGIPSGANEEQAHRAYLELTKQYHPHRYAKYADDQLTELVTEVFIGYKRAYAAFRKSIQRKPK